MVGYLQIQGFAEIHYRHQRLFTRRRNEKSTIAISACLLGEGMSSQIDGTILSIDFKGYKMLGDTSTFHCLVLDDA